MKREPKMQLERLTDDQHGKQGWRLRTDRKRIHDVYWVDQFDHKLVYQDYRQNRRDVKSKQTEPELLGIYENDCTPVQLYITCLDLLRGLWQI